MISKQTITTLVVIVAVILLSYALISIRDRPQTDEAVAKCIGENSKLYVQLGCTHCETQEKMFGAYVSYLDRTDCFYERDACKDIKVTPTWIIKGQTYEGVQSIEELKQLTGC